MANREIWHEVRIKASPGAIYEALTHVEKLAQWWIPDTRGESETGKTLEVWVGERWQTMPVAALRADRVRRRHGTEKDLSDWAGTEIEFAISPGNDQTVLRFRHS